MVRLTLYHGDCLEVMKEIPSQSIDLIITDPPYGINYSSNQGNRFDVIAGDKSINPGFLSECYRVLKESTSLYLFTRWDVYPKWLEHLKEAGFKPVNCLIWHKLESLGGMGDLEGSYISNYEFIIYATKGRKILWPGGFHRKFGYFRNTEINNPSALIHPNQKPVTLLKRFIEDSSKKGDLILDCYLGSGSTMAAALETGRDCVGIEIERNYIKTIKERLNWGSSLGDNEFQFIGNPIEAYQEAVMEGELPEI